MARPIKNRIRSIDESGVKYYFIVVFALHPIPIRAASFGLVLEDRISWRARTSSASPTLAINRQTYIINCIRETYYYYNTVVFSKKTFFYVLGTSIPRRDCTRNILLYCVEVWDALPREKKNVCITLWICVEKYAARSFENQ